MPEETQNTTSGITTIASEVIETIIIQTASETKGVNRISAHSSHPGVKLKIDGKNVNADVFVVLNAKENTNKVGAELQKNISRAIIETVGMESGKINIHVDNFELLTSEN